MKVRDAMTPSPTTCSPDTSLRSAASLMASTDCGAIPVVGEIDGFPLGVITDRDIAVRAVARGRDYDLPVRDCMTSPAITVTEDTELDECIELLEERQLRRAVVVDRSGRCTGIIAQADIASHASTRQAGELLQLVSRPTMDDVTAPH